MTDEKINSLHLWQVEWPLQMQRRHGVGDVAGSVPGIIVKLITDSGREGWGEAAPWSVFTGTAEATFHALDRYLRPLVVGSRVSEVQVLATRADKALVGHPEAKAALSIAVEDLRGRLTGLSCAELWGGVYRSEVPLSVSIADPDFDADMDFLHARLAEGVRLFKVKTGFSTHSEDMARLRSVREALPADGRLRVDYNQGLSPWDALSKLRDIEQFLPEFIEQPVPRARRDAMAELSRRINSPILADESVFSPEEAVDLVRLDYASAASIKLMKCGGIAQAKAIASILAAAGKPAYGGTMYEGGIALSAALHLACSTPNITLGAELYTAKFALGVDILKQPIDIRNGVTHLRRGTGLGVDVDLDLLRDVTTISAS